MKKLIFSIFAGLFLTFSICAQSGAGSLEGYVLSSIKNGSAIAGAEVKLHPIENRSKSDQTEVIKTDGDGRYEFRVSFGYYRLTISAEGYKTYQTKVFILSSRRLLWGTILEKKRRKS